MKCLSAKIDDIFSSTIIREETIQADVKKDPTSANLSGQAKTPGDLEDQQKMQSGEIEVSDLIDKINALRAGHSLKDKEIALSLEEYFMGLDTAEKTALFAYVKALSEIVSGVKPGKTATEPDDKDPNVTMKKPEASSHSHSKNTTLKDKHQTNVAKKANVSVTNQASAPKTTSNTSGSSLPITPKK